MATPGQDFFGRDMLFNLAPVVDLRVVTAAKQRQVDIDNVRENAKQVMHDYAIGNQVYVEMTGIYLTEHLTRSSLFSWVCKKKVFFPSFYFFRGYGNDVLFNSFYSLYLEYKHWVLQTFGIILQSYMFRSPWIELVLYKLL